MIQPTKGRILLQKMTATPFSILTNGAKQILHPLIRILLFYTLFIIVLPEWKPIAMITHVSRILPTIIWDIFSINFFLLRRKRIKMRMWVNLFDWHEGGIGRVPIYAKQRKHVHHTMLKKKLQSKSWRSIAIKQKYPLATRSFPTAALEIFDSPCESFQSCNRHRIFFF